MWAADLAGCSPETILDFSASISPLGPPVSVLEAIQTHLQALVHYPDPAYRQLRNQIAEYHGIDPDWILPGNGAAELLTWAGRDFSLLSGCYCFTPAFSDYQRAWKSYAVPVSSLPLCQSGHWRLGGHQWTQVLSTALQSTPSGQWGILLNNPHNPTGMLFERDLLQPYLDRPDLNRLMVVDEAFMDFVEPDRQQSVIDWVVQYPNLVVLRSLTKFYSIPGLRVGYAVAHPDRLRRWQGWRDPWAVNTLAAAAAVAALADRTFQQRTWEWLVPAREELYQALAAIPSLAPLPGSANFLLVGCASSVTALQQALLQRHQIYIRDCLSFAELGDHYFRVAVRTAAENRRLVQALAEVLAD